MNWLGRAPANIYEFCRCVDVSGKVSYQGHYFCSINFEDIILKFHFLRLSAPELDQTLVNDQRVGFPKMMKNDEILKISEKYQKINFYFEIPKLNASP